MSNLTSAAPSRPGLSLDWIAFIVALGLVAAVRAGLLGGVPW